MAFCFDDKWFRCNTPHLWKFVDDTTASVVVPKRNARNAQSVDNQVIKWSHINRIELDPVECKEFRISFAWNPVELNAVVIDRKEIQVVSTAYCFSFSLNFVSADQDGSRLCSYLPLSFAFELVFCLTILHGMATYRPLLPNIDQVQRKDIFYQE